MRYDSSCKIHLDCVICNNTSVQDVVDGTEFGRVSRCRLRAVDVEILDEFMVSTRIFLHHPSNENPVYLVPETFEAIGCQKHILGIAPYTKQEQKYTAILWD